MGADVVGYGRVDPRSILTTSIVRPPSVIDVAAVPLLRQQLRAALDVDPAGVIEVDMTEVAFIDSAGLAMLVGALKHARLRAGDLSITNVSARVMRILTITGLDKVFTLPARNEVSTHRPPAGPPSMARRPVASNPL